MPSSARNDAMALDKVLNGVTEDHGRKFAPDASIVLVGCRGSGKRSLGFIGAMHLRRRLITEDFYFQQVTGVTRHDYIDKYGKADYGRQSAEIFRRMLHENRRKCIIECGMSSFSDEAQAALREYCTTNPVIYIHRERRETLRLLDSADGSRILMADEKHRQCSNFEYYNLFDASQPAKAPSSSDGWEGQMSVKSSLLQVKQDFPKFLDGITGQGGIKKLFLESPLAVRAIPPEFRQYSYALRLRLSYLMHMELDWEDFEGRGDCVELIIDEWPEDLLSIIAKFVALIKRKLGLAIIYHVEENPRDQARRSPEQKTSMDTALLEHGLRLGVDYLSVDLERRDISFKEFLQRRGQTKVIGNFWNAKMHAAPWSSKFHFDNYKYARDLDCDIVRMTRFCCGDSPVEALVDFRQHLQRVAPESSSRLVAYDFSVLGVRTPLQSRVLSPVRHPDMENESDHLATVCTASQALGALFHHFDLEPLQFYVLGANVSYSLSPYIHSAAYDYTGMPHNFEALTCDNLDDLQKVCTDESFGGASLTAPFKVAIMPHLTLKSHHAEVIGAVNVLIPLRGKSNLIMDHANSRNKSGATTEFYGDNTDWASIMTCLRRNISPRNYVRPSKTTGLVIGAGGQARAAVYAMIQLGCRNIFIYNRTPANAETVANHFNDWAQRAKISVDKNGSPTRICRMLTSASEPWPADFQMPTMIVSCVPATSPADGSATEFTMPRRWLESPTGGVVLELAYEPLVTPLVAQMQVYKDTVNPAWVVVDGLENLSEMAIEAFELMTGRVAPRRLMKQVCRRTWEQQKRDGSSASS